LQRLHGATLECGFAGLRAVRCASVSSGGSMMACRASGAGQTHSIGSARSWDRSAGPAYEGGPAQVGACMTWHEANWSLQFALQAVALEPLPSQLADHPVGHARLPFPTTVGAEMISLVELEKFGIGCFSSEPACIIGRYNRIGIPADDQQWLGDPRGNVLEIDLWANSCASRAPPQRKLRMSL
jgi:hypothetical protein